jgi:sugar phosphate isomerase/epimerase
MKSAVTVSMIAEARGGPFVFWDDLSIACEKAAKLGFDAVEIFAPSAAAVEERSVRPLLGRHGLKVAALGTGGGWVKHRWTLTSADSTIRAKAVEFVRSIIDAAAAFGAPAIIGSMQGRWDDQITSETAAQHLSDALHELAEHAQSLQVQVMFEPLNRYETNLVNTLAEGAALLRPLKSKNLKLLADLYHMNIEEEDLAGAIRQVGELVGHVHLADSNRRPAGNGHTDFAAIAGALRDINYNGYLSAECLPWPDPDAAASQTMQAFRRYFR